MRLRPSDANRWVNCPGSLKFQEQLGLEKSDSIYAESGRLAHDIAHNLLLCQRDDRINDLDLDLRSAIYSYVDYVTTIGFQERAFYEIEVDIHNYADISGTCDAIVFDECDNMTIVDLKTGRNPVFAEQNLQLLIYALGAYEHFKDEVDITKIKLVIHQDIIGNISEFELTPEQLIKFGGWIAAKAEAVYEPNAYLKAGTHCTYCPLKAECTAVAATSTNAIQDLAKPEILSEEKMRHVLDNKKLILDWIAAIEEHASARLTLGQGFLGYKLVAGRKMRKWSNENMARNQLNQILGDDCMEHKLISVAKAEKMLGGDLNPVLDIIEYKEGKPTLAKISDKRPAVNFTVNDFDVLVDNNVTKQ